MKACPLLLIAALFMYGCAEQTVQTKDAPETDVVVADDPLEDAELFQGDPEESPDPLITFIRTTDGKTTTSKVLLSKAHLSEFPAPNIGNPKDVWDESVKLEITFDGDSRTQTLSYRTKASAEEYVEFFSTELSGAKVETQGSTEIVKGKNEFGDDVEMQYTPASSEGGFAQVRITAQG